MRSFSLFLVLCILVIGVIATGNEPSSSAAPAGRNPDGFTLEMTESPTIQPFLEKINNLKDRHGLFPNLEQTNMSPWSPSQLIDNLKLKAFPRRFLFLGKQHGVPEMYLAVPHHSDPRGFDRKIVWSLIYAHKHRPNTLVHHGYIFMTGGDLVISKFKEAKYTEKRPLEIGDVLTIEEVFKELRMFLR
ncbi:uncharacterized protein UHOD_12262 [Ustilago sp. UG-2017b]|nr:uncharacterized protein UHOD_12262 [Ustilago sp. UG-2017b]